MEYNGYVGSIEFSENDGVFYGKVQNIPSLISYEGRTLAELVDDFVFCEIIFAFVYLFPHGFALLVS